MKSVSQLGEWATISRFQSLSKPISHSFLKTMVPSGDDAYVAKLVSSTTLVTTTDTLVEGTHFDPRLYQKHLSHAQIWRAIGYKSMAVNLSDLAAMGEVQPLFAFLTLGVRGDISVDTVDNFRRGMQKLLKIHGFFIAGGDTIHADKSIISICLVGKLRKSYPLTRSGARIGDVIAVTGPLGRSQAGLEILKKGIKSSKSSYKKLIQAHLTPKPKLKEGQILSQPLTRASSLMDTSDDLFTSLEHLRKSSHVGFEISLENLPLAPELKEYTSTTRISPDSYMIYGGEDYQLLFTLSPSRVRSLLTKLPQCRMIGNVVPYSHGIRLIKNGVPVSIKDRRFRHF